MIQELAEKEIQAQVQAHHMPTTMTAQKVKRFFVAKGYTVCNITPISNSRKWFAILIKNHEYIIATVFTSENGIESIEESIMR